MLATWEDLDYMKKVFPYAPAWGQAAFQGGGNVIAAGLEVYTTLLPDREQEEVPRRSAGAGKPKSGWNGEE